MARDNRSAKEKRYQQLENKILFRRNSIEEQRKGITARRDAALEEGNPNRVKWWAAHYDKRMADMDLREHREVGPLMEEYTELFKELYDTDE